jgi:hypothetical protein
MRLADEIAMLPTLSVAQLRVRYTEVFGESTAAANKIWLMRRLAWRLQAMAQGDLSERARQRAAQLANDADLRLLPPARQNVEPSGVAVKNADQSVTPNQVNVFVPAAVALVVSPDPRLPPSGSVITRLYKGQRLEVTVLPGGFAYQDKVFFSLSALAKAITGSHCNGFRFFGLTQAEIAP